jgi:hypothetical protein
LRARTSISATGGITAAPIVRSGASVPSFRAEQAGWRAAMPGAYAPQHVPAALYKRDAFAPSGARDGDPPV